MEKTRVVIMGAGLGGLGAGVKLKEAGIEDFLIFERNPKVGERTGGLRHPSRGRTDTCAVARGRERSQRNAHNHRDDE